IFVSGELLAAGNMESLGKQLFLTSPFVIEVVANPINQSLIENLKTLNNVNKVEVNDDILEVYCEEDISPIISKVIVESNSELYKIQKKNFGLDEIYHRYFEGGDEDEASSTN